MAPCRRFWHRSHIPQLRCPPHEEFPPKSLLEVFRQARPSDQGRLAVFRNISRLKGMNLLVPWCRRLAQKHLPGPGDIIQEMPTCFHPEPAEKYSFQKSA
jgi:hypothetical protein